VNLSATTANMETKITALLSALNTAHLVDGATHTLINATAASTAMVNYITSNALKNDKKFTQAYLSGKTFYVVSNWGAEGWVSLTNTFHSNGTYSYYDAPDANATVNYEVTTDGRLKIISQDPSDPVFYATIKAVTDEYIEVNEYTESTATYKSTNTYLYFNKAKADDKLIQLLKPLFASKTFYVVGIDPQDHAKYFNSAVMNADVTSVTATILDLNGNPVTNATTVYPDPLAGVTVSSTIDYLIMHDSEGNKRLYFDKAKAQAYYNSLPVTGILLD
jgi:hypothetical protein